MLAEDNVIEISEEIPKAGISSVSIDNRTSRIELIRKTAIP